jgi:asparagine synthase (glutamine-hydrolysing)
MCGIAGFIDLRGKRRAEPAVLGPILETISHRGPDSSGIFCSGAAALGFRRLAIIDPAGSEQPLFNEDHTLAMVGNGEIYNYVELRDELRAAGHTFLTDGDMEVVLHLFEEYGAYLTRKLKGQFSLAILEIGPGRLHLFRDPFGITPLHYARLGDEFVFASEVKAILRHPSARATLDLVALDQALCFPGVVSPRTIIRDVSSLPPGYRLTVDRGVVTSTRYWDLDYPAATACRSPISEDAAVTRFRELFNASVLRRLRADVPVGLYLSGGLDSSYVGASLREVAPDHDLTTFSIVFPNSRAINERRYQLLMARELGSHHVEIPFDESEIAGLLRQMVWHAEVPVTETYNVCSMAMAEAARAHGVKVVLGGEGSDELLAGYPGYRFDALSAASERGGSSPDEARVRHEVWGDAAIRYERRYADYRAFRNRFLSPVARDMLAEEDCLSSGPVDPAMLAGRAPVHQRSYLDMKLRLADHLLGDHGDRMAMAHSVEARYPFLDTDLVEFLVELDPELKLNGMTEKYLLRRAAEGRIPDAILRREKFGFRAPGSGYLLGGQDKALSELVSRERIEADGIFDADTVLAEVDRHREGRAGSNPHAEDDIPLLVMTSAILVDAFGIERLA